MERERKNEEDLFRRCIKYLLHLYLKLKILFIPHFIVTVITLTMALANTLIILIKSYSYLKYLWLFTLRKTLLVDRPLFSKIGKSSRALDTFLICK